MSERCARPGCDKFESEHWSNYGHAFVPPPASAGAVADEAAKANDYAKDRGLAPPYPVGEMETLAADEWTKFPYRGYSWVDCRAMVSRIFDAGRLAGAREERERLMLGPEGAQCEALAVLGEALYPGLGGDSPKGTANTLWAFAKEAARRLADTRTYAQGAKDMRERAEAVAQEWADTWQDAHNETAEGIRDGIAALEIK